MFVKVNYTYATYSHIEIWIHLWNKILFPFIWLKEMHFYIQLFIFKCHKKEHKFQICFKLQELFVFMTFFNYSWHFVFKKNTNHGSRRTRRKSRIYSSVSKKKKKKNKNFKSSKNVHNFWSFIHSWILLYPYYIQQYYTAYVIFLLSFFLIKKNPSFYQHQKRSHIRSKKKAAALWKYVCWYFINQGKIKTKTNEEKNEQ